MPLSLPATEITKHSEALCVPYDSAGMLEPASMQLSPDAIDAPVIASRRCSTTDMLRACTPPDAFTLQQTDPQNACAPASRTLDFWQQAGNCGPLQIVICSSDEDCSYPRIINLNCPWIPGLCSSEPVSQQAHPHTASPLLVAPSAAVAGELMDMFHNMKAVVTAEQQHQLRQRGACPPGVSLHCEPAAPAALAAAHESADLAAEAVTFNEHFKPLLLDIQSITAYSTFCQDASSSSRRNNHSIFGFWDRQNTAAAPSQLPLPDFCAPTAASIPAPTTATAADKKAADEAVKGVMLGRTLVVLLQFLGMHNCWCTMSWLLAEAYKNGLLQHPQVMGAVQTWQLNTVMQLQQQPGAPQDGAAVAAAVTSGLFNAVAAAAPALSSQQDVPSSKDSSSLALKHPHMAEDCQSSKGSGRGAATLEDPAATAGVMPHGQRNGRLVSKHRTTASSSTPSSKSLGTQKFEVTCVLLLVLTVLPLLLHLLLQPAAQLAMLSW